MSDLILNSIPVVSLNGQAKPELEQIKKIGDSLRTWGFVTLVDHGIELELLEQAYQIAREVFALSSEQKYSYEDLEGGRQRGYTPFLVEKAKGESQADLKEFWHIGRELTPEHPFRINGLMRPNRYPSEVPAFKTVMSRLYTELDQLAHYILKVIALDLELDPNCFEAIAQDGNSILRVLHYPDFEKDSYVGKVRAAAHEDINLLTLLPAATQPGLELLSKTGEWLPIIPPQGAIICDTGDMMSALTGGILPATTHRVVNPDGGADGGRLSLPFFMHPHPHAKLCPSSIDLPVDALQRSVEGEGLTAHEFLLKRLQDNGLT